MTATFMKNALINVLILLQEGKEDRAAHRLQGIIQHLEIMEGLTPRRYGRTPAGTRLCLLLQHYLHPLHIWCRLMDLGISRKRAIKLGRLYEELLCSIRKRRRDHG
ncbi:MAG: hypothetical protein JW932_15535 [Deltaproteobacteria bacterium]|nr:hypothetical protein [Deltaproteobacteria bacterium]